VTIDEAELIEGGNLWGETAMDADNSAVNDTGDGEQVKHLHAHAPAVRITELLLALVVESIDLSDLATLVVASEENDLVRILGLHEHQKCEGLETVITAVNVVAHEDVGTIRDLAANAEELEKVVELAVDVAANGDGGCDGLHVRLFKEAFLDQLTKSIEVLLREVFALSHSHDPSFDLGHRK